MKALLKALAGFQHDCPAVKKSADNPFFKSKYATLDAIQHHIQPYLTKHGLVVTQRNITQEAGIFVKTEVYEAVSGECIDSVFPIIVQKNTPQDYGSAVSYAKRYSLSGLLNLVIADEDDDGNTASNINPTIKESAGSGSVKFPFPLLNKGEVRWLNDNTQEFTTIKELVEKGATLTDVRKYFSVSKKVADKLLEKVKTIG